MSPTPIPDRPPRRRSPALLRAAIGILIAVAVIYIVYASTHTANYRVQVCLRYHGASACKTAEGRTRQEAFRGAHDLACSQITSGVTGTLGCQNTPATKVTWYP